MAEDVDLFGLGELAMTGHEGLSTTIWALSLAVLGLIVVVLWRWSGTTLPPAAVVDKKYVGEPLPESPPPKRNSPNGAELGMRGRIASDKMYEGVPILETVTVRAFVLESLIMILCGLVFVDSGATILRWLNKEVVEFPIISGVIAALCFAAALFVGAIRQLCGSLLSHAGALPMVDDRGQPMFGYVGDVPPHIWLYSPWFRAATWVLVAAASLLGAFIVSVASDQVIKGTFVPALVAVLVLRWLISSIPKRLMQRHYGEPH
jgi:hypothetical protein